MRRFQDLHVWERAHALTVDVYRISQQFPGNEMYGLTSQLRRSCVSIEANLAEGCGRRSEREFLRFLHIAMGSAAESECHLLIARDLGMLSSDEFERCTKSVEEVKRMLNGLMDRVAAGMLKQAAEVHLAES
ncbi:MAG: four helix bundle protein [Acidobacteria bacterium]|nr:four helix bundle protein [Acidobacteriota bacterium]